jgi:SAM-dependent methyltransferase
MKHDIMDIIHRDLCRSSEARLEYLRKAYRMLPTYDDPDILDIGCGRGGPTLELARLSGGRITGVDIDEEFLGDFSRKISELDLTDRVRAVNRSMLDLDFDDGSFDIIWAEAAISIIGFSKGLDLWKRLLKPGGSMVVHMMAWVRDDPPREILDSWLEVYPPIGSLSGCIADAERFGYSIIGHFTMPEDFWRREYFGPLAERIEDYRNRYKDDGSVIEQLEEGRREIDLYERCGGWFGSAYLLMKRGHR